MTIYLMVAVLAVHVMMVVVIVIERPGFFKLGKLADDHVALER